MIPCVGCVSVNATVILTDGVSIAAGYDDNKIRIWLQNGTLLRTLTGH